MNERAPRRPGEKPDEAETAEAKPTTTDPPASDVRPSVPHPVAPKGNPAKNDNGEPDRADGARADGDVAAKREKSRGNGKTKDANDVQAPPPDLTTRLARLAKRDWHGKIIGWHIKKFRLPKYEVEDVFQDACVEALKETDWPAEEKPTLTWLFTITRHTCYDHLRSEKRRREREVPLEDLDFSVETEAKEQARDLLDFIDVTRLEVPEIASGVEMLAEHHVLGEDAKDIADKNSIRVGLVYERMSTARAVIQSRWLKVGAGLAAAIAILILLVRLQDDDRNKVSAGHDRLPEPEIPLLPLPPHQSAAELRGRGLQHCQEKHYEWCLECLNRARRMDPAGEKDPKVTAARREAEAKMRE